MKISKCIVVYTIPRTDEQRTCLKKVEEVLKRNQVDFHIANRDFLVREQFKNVNLVVAVGGDGTFLRAVQFMKKGLVIGVNADPKNKEGFFMKARKDDFEEKLQSVMKGNFKIRKLPRLEASVNGRTIDSLAINEFFIGPNRGYQAAKYTIQVGKRKERHKSSGVLVTTPAGSNAWGMACGAKKIHLDEEVFQYVVREPYMGKVFKDYEVLNGKMMEHEKVVVISEMLHGIIVADSVGREHHLRPEDKIVVRMSKNSIDALWD
jgi:NAD kinase